MGREVKTLVNNFQQAGYQNIVWMGQTILIIRFQAVFIYAGSKLLLLTTEKYLQNPSNL
jgi:hypothetical protein